MKPGSHPAPIFARAVAALPPRRSLFGKYFIALFAAVLLSLVVNGASEAWFGYHDQRSMIDARLRTEARSAAGSIQDFLGSMTAQLGWLTHLPVAPDMLEQSRFDALRLLRQVPGITEVAHLDADGRERVRVSRLAMDAVDSNLDRSAEAAFLEASAGKPYYGPVYFRRGSEPYMTIAVAGTRRSAGVAIAEVNLKSIWNTVSKVEVGEGGFALVADARGRLIAHPDMARVLRGTDDDTAAAIRSLRTASDAVTTVQADGRQLIAAAATIVGPDWMVLVEQPLAEAFAPIYTALWRTLVLILAGAALAAALAYLLARRMTGPIRLLEEGAEQIGSGRFEHRIEIGSSDELGRLAARFNQMADELALSQERSERIMRLRQFLAPQVAELIERTRSDALLDSQRSEVVVIFCDLRNFTAFSTRAEPEEIMSVLGAYYGALGTLITRYEATQTSFFGDGLMMLLNAPVPCADPASKAVEMAIAMQAAVQALAADWRRRGHAIGFGIGIAQGIATVGRIGYEKRLDYTAIGMVVNLAARLCSAALDGQILIDAVAAAAVGTEHLEALGQRRIRGFDEELPVYAVAARE
jgi:class 3 adenylate cyclase